jgi:hypothetical protein
MSSSKKIYLSRNFKVGVHLPGARTPYPPLHTTCIRVYIILIHTVKGERGEELNQREGWRGNSSQSWGNTNMTDCISSIKTLIDTCRKVPLQSFFLDDNILLWCLYS